MGHERILLFVGRLIRNKGIQSVLAALPLILEKQPRVRLLVVGHGPLRELMEVLLWALEHGKWSLVRDILAWGEPLQEAQEEPFEELSCFYRRLEKNSRLESYFRSASLYMQRDRVIFTGYLTHEELRYLFPCCDVAIFPSTVIEAGPLVFLEALASSCLPVGTYFGGMRASIDSVAGRLSPAHAKCMKLSPEPEDTVADIITSVPKALVVADRYREALRDIAVRRC